jgi:dTDP-4-amino-4,6-dideoxygalactose transaminase
MNAPILFKNTKYPNRCPVYFWRPWYPSSTFFELLYKFDKLFDQDYIKKTIRELEFTLKEYFRCDYVIFTPSGSASIFLVCKTILNKNEVLLPSLVCDVVPHTIQQSGNPMNFLEVNSSTYNIDENDILNKITSKTGAILAVHQFGFPCQMDTISDIVKDKNCLLIEDAAQSFGAEYKNKKVGTIGDIGIFSFNNKVLDACGGGLIVTNNQQYYRKMNEIAESQFSIDYNKKRIIRNLIRSWLLSDYPRIGNAIGGLVSKEFIPELTEKINSITPLLVQNIFPEIEKILCYRKKNFNYYLSYLKANKIIKPKWENQMKPSFTFCTLRFANTSTRNIIKSMLSKKGIQSAVLAQSAHRKYNSKLHLPATDLVANTMLSFPTDPHIDEKHILCVTDRINQILYDEPNYI